MKCFCWEKRIFIKELSNENIKLEHLNSDFDKLYNKVIYWRDIIVESMSNGENVPADDDLYFEEIPKGN